MVKLNRSVVAAAIVSGCLGLAANSVGAKESTYSSREAMRSQYLSRSGDDSSLPSGVPGVTEENTSDMTSGEVKRVQQALSTKGYDPGRSDGTMTNDTRVAIREFQKDNGIVMTGSVDSRTAARLGIEFTRSSG